MPLSLYDASVPPMRRAIDRLQHVLRIGEAFARERGLDPAELLQRRLAEDMFSLVRQVQIASDTAKASVARLSGAQAPSWPDDEADFDALYARLERTAAYLDAADRAAIDGAEAREIVMPTRTRGELRFDGRDYVQQFALPNVYFHVVTAYGILRHAGAPVGKWDYLGPIG